MKMVGMRPAKADHTLGPGIIRSAQVMLELEPFVAADERVDQVQPQDSDVDACRREPRQVEGLEGGLGEHGMTTWIRECEFYTVVLASGRRPWEPACWRIQSI